MKKQYLTTSVIAIFTTAAFCQAPTQIDYPSTELKTQEIY
jgi:hypothetical protein